MDNVLREAGSCGRFQAIHVIFTQLPRFAMVWAVFLMMFGSYDPGWKCVRRLPPGLNISNNTQQRFFRKAAASDKEYFLSNADNTFYTSSERSISRTEEQTVTAGVDEIDEILNLSNLTLKQQLISKFNLSRVNSSEKYDGTCDIIHFCDGIEFDPASVTVLTKFELICDRAWIVKCIFILQGVGYFFGALLGGQMGETFGRKIALYSSCLVVCLSTGLAIISPHWIMYAVCIFFLGVGANGVISLASVFSMEFLNSKWRGYFGSFPTWNVSLCLFTLATAAVKDWVYLHLATFLMTLFSCIGFIVVVESPRWLLMNNRPERAEKAIKKIAIINRKKSFPTMETLLQIKADEESVENSKRNYSYMDLFRTSEIRKATLKMATIMGSFGMIYYALGFGVQSLPGNFYVNAVGSSACEIIVIFIIGPLCNRLGRRTTGEIVAVYGGISCGSIVIALFAAEGSTQSLVIKIFAFQAKGMSQAIFQISQLFVVELLPTVVRNVGIGFCRCAAGLGSLIAPFLIPSAHDVTSFALCFSVLCLLFCLQLAIFITLPETNNLDLKDGIKPMEVTVIPPKNIKIPTEEC